MKIRVPYIPSPDWSKGMVTQESDFDHGLSKGSLEVAISVFGAGAIGRLRGGAVSGDLMAESGQLGGRLYDLEKLAKLARYLERRGIVLNPALNGSFDGVRGAMTLPRSPTILNVRHELSHYLDFKRFGADYYTRFSSFAREELVLERLRKNRVWNTLNELERKWSDLYPLSRPGGQAF
jgi:hypothetical protein